MSEFDAFKKVVKNYAKAYAMFEKFQHAEQNIFIPKKGDQKTGVIGEAYIYEYLSRKGERGLAFGGHSEKGWDIKTSKRTYQVKTVSAYSKTEVVSPIHDNWNFLYLIHLNYSFEPDKVYCVKNPNPGNWTKSVVRGVKFPKDDAKGLRINGEICALNDVTKDFMEKMGF